MISPNWYISSEASAMAPIEQTPTCPELRSPAYSKPLIQPLNFEAFSPVRTWTLLRNFAQVDGESLLLMSHDSNPFDLSTASKETADSASSSRHRAVLHSTAVVMSPPPRSGS